MIFPLEQEHCFARGQDSRSEDHGIPNPCQVEGKMMFLSCAISYQTGAKYLRTGEQYQHWRAWLGGGRPNRKGPPPPPLGLGPPEPQWASAAATVGPEVGG